MLIEQPPSKGAAKAGWKENAVRPPEQRSEYTLQQAGIDRKLSMTAQRTARMPETEFEASILVFPRTNSGCPPIHHGCL
jgi:hypothetical protein